jgi:hypothetical protein
MVDVFKLWLGALRFPSAAIMMRKASHAHYYTRAPFNDAVSAAKIIKPATSSFGN